MNKRDLNKRTTPLIHAKATIARAIDRAPRCEIRIECIRHSHGTRRNAFAARIAFARIDKPGSLANRRAKVADVAIDFAHIGVRHHANIRKFLCARTNRTKHRRKWNVVRTRRLAHPATDTRNRHVIEPRHLKQHRVGRHCERAVAIRQAQQFARCVFRIRCAKETFFAVANGTRVHTVGTLKTIGEITRESAIASHRGVKMFQRRITLYDSRGNQIPDHRRARRCKRFVISIKRADGIASITARGAA